MLDDENIDFYVSVVDNNAETTDGRFKEDKKTRKNGLLNWLKLRVCTLSYFCFFTDIVSDSSPTYLIELLREKHYRDWIKRCSGTLKIDDLRRRMIFLITNLIVNTNIKIFWF